MDDDEFDFSDNDLDDLPANTLQQLETTAIRATQQIRHDADDSAYYGLDVDDDDGDEVINLDDATDAPRFRQVQQHHDYSPALNGNGNDESNMGLYGGVMHVDVDDEPPRQSQADVSKLLLRIKKLEQEKRRLNSDLQSATAEANKKAGEADNLRRRSEAASRTTEQRIAAQQREHRESADRLASERDKLLRQLEQAKTSNAFDEYNARQGEQMRRPRRTIPARPKPAAAASPSTTPKKAQKNLPLGDGFDDDDIVMASPSKRREKSKAATPKQASKRKRQVTNDSPIPALQLSEPRERPKAPEPAPSTEGRAQVTLLRNLGKDDHRFALLHRLLSHRCSNGTDRVLEALTQHAFPSQPQQKLSSVVYDTLAASGQAPGARELALRICNIFQRLWKQCLREKFYAPLYLLIDALQFVLACEPAKTAVDISEQLIPLIVESIKLVAVPIHQAAHRDEKRVTALFSPKQRAIESDIDVEGCLDLLHLLATSCYSSPSADAVPHFWRTMPPDFVLLMLIKEQPLPHMTMMLRILSTSALPTSFGPIGSDEPRDQASLESNLITRLTNLFSETIEPISDPRDTTPAPVPEPHIWRIRLRVLDLLTHFSISEHGCAALAQHKLCFGRLAKYLNHCITSLYTHPLSPTQSLKIASINASMKLIHHLVTSSKNPELNVTSKLEATLGGHHAFHVSLTRLAFSEALVLEAGIEPGVVDMAHDVLDGKLSLEEGEALAMVFPSGGSV